MDLAEYVFRPLRGSEEFILHRGLAKQVAAASVLMPVSVSTLMLFLRFALDMAIALTRLDKRELIHKDLKRFRREA